MSDSTLQFIESTMADGYNRVTFIAHEKNVNGVVSWRYDVEVHQESYPPGFDEDDESDAPDYSARGFEVSDAIRQLQEWKDSSLT